MQQFKEGAEIIEGRMTFLQEFLQKKYGWGILFFVVIVIGVVAFIVAYNRGKDEGKETAKEEINSLKNTHYNDSVEMYTLRGRVAYYKKLNDTCNERGAKSFNIQFEEKLREMDRLNGIMEKRIQSREILNENNKNLLPK